MVQVDNIVYMDNIYTMSRVARHFTVLDLFLLVLTSSQVAGLEVHVIKGLTCSLTFIAFWQSRVRQE